MWSLSPNWHELPTRTSIQIQSRQRRDIRSTNQRLVRRSVRLMLEKQIRFPTICFIARTLFLPAAYG